MVSPANLNIIWVSKSNLKTYGATLHFDASEPSSIVYSGSKVVSWTDLIREVQFTQTTDSLRPTTTTQNGKNALAFNGSS